MVLTEEQIKQLVIDMKDIVIGKGTILYYLTKRTSSMPYDILLVKDLKEFLKTYNFPE